MRLINQFQKFASENSLNDLKKQSILDVPADYITRNFGQIDRFTFVEKNGIKHIVFLQNDYRLTLIEQLDRFMQSGTTSSKIIGARGVGKSHFLALFVFHLRFKIISESLPRRIMYINDPALYFYDFRILKNDIIQFLGNDYLENKELRKQLDEPQLFCCFEKVYDFLFKITQHYLINNIRFDLVIDQFNNLTSSREKRLAIYEFFMKFKDLFGVNVIIGACNDDDILRNINAQEINLSAENFLKNENEAIHYLKSLNYFNQIFLNSNQFKLIKKIKRVTNFNPFEMMILNNNSAQLNSVTLDDKLIEQYERFRFQIKKKSLFF